MKLYEIPNKSKLMVRVNGELLPATFHHIDGMYSLCTLDGRPQPNGIFHLYAAQEMAKVGDHYELVEEPEESQ